jgi:hypothetical protein
LNNNIKISIFLKLYRYHLVITNVSWKGLPMQDLAGCDNNRTPVKFQGYDNCNIVGDSAGIAMKREQATQNSLEEGKILWADLAVALGTLNVTLHVDFYYG